MNKVKARRLIREWRVALVGMVAISIVCGGCSTPSRSSARSLSGVGAAQSRIVSPLSVVVVKPEMLTAINCLAIARPTFSRAAVDRKVAEESVQPSIERVADQVLGLKVVKAPSSSDRAPSSAESLAAVAKQGADAVLLTEIHSYRDVVGSAIGGEPATIAFTMSIRASRSGEEVWQGKYFYRQEALSENLLKLGERLGSNGAGPGWVSGHALFEKGVSEALSDFGARREGRFFVGSQ